jgi:hypothetical protein
MTLLKNFRFGDDARYNVQAGAEVFNLLDQRIRTLGTATGSQSSIVVGAPSGVNVRGAFANVNSPFFNDYSTGVFGGRTVQLRAKFVF